MGPGHRAGGATAALGCWWGDSHLPLDPTSPLTSLAVPIPSQLPEQEVVNLFIPTQAVGAIIGKKGQHIKQLARFAGASIKVRWAWALCFSFPFQQGRSCGLCLSFPILQSWSWSMPQFPHPTGQVLGLCLSFPILQGWSWTLCLSFPFLWGLCASVSYINRSSSLIPAVYHPCRGGLSHMGGVRSHPSRATLTLLVPVPHRLRQQRVPMPASGWSSSRGRPRRSSRCGLEGGDTLWDKWGTSLGSLPAWVWLRLGAGGGFLLDVVVLLLPDISTSSPPPVLLPSRLLPRPRGEYLGN